MKNYIHFIAFLLQLLGLLVYSLIEGDVFLTLFNIITYVFLFHLVVYLSLTTLHARFFDGFMYGMHRVFRSKKRPGSMDTAFEPVSEKINQPVITFFKYQTGLFLVFNILLLAVYLTF
ncbi:protein of unknown function [Halolactibacillus halophilus]|uniref:DUF3899 domain-containing protein n=1 Tax=Halolactibacillus halophilus TaxID=306540 RepID=A0A1I5PQ16_9BACI|nr:DUF3899 domain-containing protein [Halolactibacillus halophilus]GEM01580.1 hypothetical protein HHA03_11120 [Halolactibacillus halophilus]SFP36232.1 protein of unknown function [Halolactibacillus halophilus]